MKIKILISLCIILVALIWRLYNFEARAPFDWDQNRDYGEVAKIATGHFITLGPVAKGEGGFYLGSLYYYLLYPAYFLMQGSLSALPLTSLIIDALVAGLLFLLLHKIIGQKQSIILAILWSTSWFLVDASRVSWNVALVPMWSLFTFYSIYYVIKYQSRSHFYLLGLLTGLAVHIHVSAIPIIPVVLIVFFKKIKFPLMIWLKMMMVAIIPIIPLMLFDLKHNFLNLHLLRNQISFQVATKTKILPMILMTFTKLGKVVSGLFVSKFADNIFLGFIIMIVAIKSYFFDKRIFQQIAGAILIIATSLVIVLRDYGFPEYYFITSYLAIFIIVIGNLPKLALYTLFGLSLFLNLRSYTTEPGVYSLKAKEEIVQTLLEFKEPIDLNYQFDPGRDGGFGYLVELKNIKIDPKSQIRILLTDKLNTPLYIDGELARDLVQIGKIKTAIYIVQ